MSKQTSARKSRRDRKPNVPPYTGPVGPNELDAAAEVAADDASPVKMKSSSTGRAAAGAPSGVNLPVDFRAEYGYVGRDLKQMALVAAGMFVLLIALSFVIL